MKYFLGFGALASLSQLAVAGGGIGGFPVSEPSMIAVYGAGIAAVVVAKLAAKKKGQQFL